MGEQEEAVRRDPDVQQAWKIAEVARARLLESVDVGDAEALAEAQRMLDALRKATDLVADAEDRARVHVGLLSQAEADRRATERHTPPDGRSARPGKTSRRSLGHGIPLVEHPALAALLSLVAAAAAWLVARTLARHRKRSR
jgi:hypothetical protein